MKRQGTAISKLGLKIGRNKKKSSPAAKFSLLTALTELDDFNEDLTAHDKEVLREIDPLSKRIT